MIFKGKITPRKLEEIEEEGDSLLQALPSDTNDLDSPAVNARLLEIVRYFRKRAVNACPPNDKERTTITSVRDKLHQLYKQTADRPELEPWRKLMINAAEQINYILQRIE